MIYHNSHLPRYRDPLGPVPAGGRLTVRLRCDESDAPTLRAWSGEERRYAMRRVEPGLYEATVRVPDAPMLFWYDFVLPTADGELRYGNADDELGGEGRLWRDGLKSYQCTVFDPAYRTPAYLRNAVIYQIFPDRFHRAETDPAAVEAARLSAHPEATIHASWAEAPLLDPDPANGDNRALDFFLGNLRGIREKLPYLAELGVTVLYLNPVFRARTNHRYDTGDYLQIDPFLGDNADFAALCEAARALGMRVLLDGVFSHTGADSRYFNRFGRYDGLGAYQSPDSPYAGWYRFSRFPDEYDSWWGFYTLPAVRKDDPGYRRFLLDGDAGVLPAWVRRGACGWRLDVADELPVDLLREMRCSLKATDPDATLLGEVWEDASNKVAYGQPRSYCLGDTLDSVMNYPLRRAVIDFFTGACDAYALCRLLDHQREVYPAPFRYALMNLLGSHDRLRALNAMVGYDLPDGVYPDRARDARVTLSPDELALGKRRYAAALRLLCALPGAPTVYYGDERGMAGMADPFCRAPMRWADGDEALTAEVRALLRWRRETPMLRSGLCDARPLSADALVVTRYASGGLDALGEPLAGEPLSVTVTRELR